jgi:hypothetical protein
LKFRPLGTGTSLVFREEHEPADWQYKLNMPGQNVLTGTRVFCRFFLLQHFVFKWRPSGNHDTKDSFPAVRSL